MSAAEKLTHAAAVLRERAGAATPGEWVVSTLGHEVVANADDDTSWDVADVNVITPWNDDRHRAAAYIATVSPPFALAVADWLDDEAMTAAALGEHDRVFGTESFPEATRALAVASAVLGEDAGGDGR